MKGLKTGLALLFWALVLAGGVPWGTVRLGLGRWPSGIGVEEVAGGALVGMGVALVLWVAWVFVGIGQGTPLPFDPPRRLVKVGPFRYVRNPMYLGGLLILLGEALLLRSWAVLLLALVAFLGLNALLLWFEEPQLKRRFGEEYLAYMEEVPRWLPRWRPSSRKGPPSA